MKCLRKIDEYVPRHMRLGLSCDVPVLDSYQDVLESIPVVDDTGVVVSTYSVVKSLPAHEVMQKYRLSQFRLSALVRNGVPLKMVNVNASNVATMQQLRDVAEKLDNADKYVERVFAEKKERESWFNPDLNV